MDDPQWVFVHMARPCFKRWSPDLHLPTTMIPTTPFSNSNSATPSTIIWWSSNASPTASLPLPHHSSSVASSQGLTPICVARSRRSSPCRYHRRWSSLSFKRISLTTAVRVRGPCRRPLPLLPVDLPRTLLLALLFGAYLRRNWRRPVTRAFVTIVKTNGHRAIVVSLVFSCLLSKTTRIFPTTVLLRKRLCPPQVLPPRHQPHNSAFMLSREYRRQRHSAWMEPSATIVLWPSVPHYLQGSCPVEAVDTLLSDHTNIRNTLHRRLLKAKASMKCSANAHRQDVQYSVSDWVNVRLRPYHKTLVTNQYHKLSKRYFGPFQITELIAAVAYRLQIPKTAKIHLVFHVLLLKPHQGPPPITSGTLPTMVHDNNPIVHPLTVSN